MSLLDDLSLGKNPLEEKEPLDLRGDGPVQGYPLEPLVSPFEQPNAQTPEPVGPYEYPVDPARAQDYKDLKSFNTDTKAAGTRASEYEGLASAKNKLLSDFEGGLMQKHWNSMFHNPDDPNEIEDVPVLKRGKKPVDEWYKELDDHVGMRFGDDSINHKKLKQLKQRHSNLYNDWDRADRVGKKARFQHTSMLDTYLSTPEHLREASKSWKEENPGKEISPATQEQVLNDTKFEEPSFDPSGKVANPTKVDPRFKDPFGAEQKVTKEEVEARRNKYRTDYDAKSKEKTLSKNLRKHGWLYSKMAEVAGRSIFLTEDERDHLDLADAAKSGWVKYVGGQPVEEVLDSLGGTEKETVARIIDNVGKAHSQWERVQLAFVNNWKSKGYDQAKEVLELERKKWGAVLQVAKEYGLANRVITQGKSTSYWSNVVDEFMAGIKDEDATEIVPELAGLEELTRSDVTEFIKVMQELEEHPESEVMKKYNEASPEGIMEALGYYFVNPEVILPMAARVMSSYGNTYIDNAMTTVPTGMAVGLLTRGPQGALSGGALALKANIGLTSGVMEYAQTFTTEMEKEGIDWQNPDIFMKAFTNPELLSRLRKKPMLRSVAVGLTDQLYAGIAGRTNQLVKRPAALKKLPNGLTAFKAELNQGVQASARRRILGGFAELGTGATFGSSGEALAQYLTEGGIHDHKAIVAEGVLEMAGPGGWAWALNSGREALSKDLTLEDLTKAEAQVLSSNRDESGVVEDIDQNGWKYQRRRFDSANQLISYLESKGKLDTSTPEGYIFARMMGFAGLTGHLQKLGVVISDRTPLSEKNTRGGYHKGVIFLNEKALEGRESTASHVLLHEGGHFIQDFMMAPDEAWSLYTQALPDEESRKLSYAQYLFGRRITDLSNLSNKELRTLNKRFSQASEDTMVAEWITQQMGLALATISGITTTAENASPDIKKKVQTLIEKVITGDDPAVNQFFPAELGGVQEQVAMALLQLLGIDPVTLENNRNAFNQQGTFGPGGDRASMVNPTLIDFTDIENFTPKQKEEVAKVANFRSWDDIPQSWIDEAIEIWGGKKAEVPTTVDESGQVSMDLENVVPAEPAIADISDPNVQTKINEGDPQARKASRTQEEGKGLDSLAASPEKPNTKWKTYGKAPANEPPEKDGEFDPEGTWKQPDLNVPAEPLSEDEAKSQKARLKEEPKKIEKSQKEMAEKSKAKKEEAEQGKDVKITPAETLTDKTFPLGRTELEEKKLARKRGEAPEPKPLSEEAKEARKEKVGITPKKKKEEAKKEKPTEETEKVLESEKIVKVDERDTKRITSKEGEVLEIASSQEENVRKHLVDPYDNEKEADAALKQRENIAEDWTEFDDQMVVAQDRLTVDGQPITETNLLIKMLDIDADVTKPFDELFAGSDKLSKTFKNLTSGQLNQENTDQAINELTKALEDAFPAFRDTEEIVRNVLVPFGVHQITSSEMNQISGTVDPESGVFFRENSSKGYPGRTRENASSTDATIAIATDFTTAGEKSTKRYVEKAEKKYIPIDISGEQAADTQDAGTQAAELEVTNEMVEKVVADLNSVKAESINIAGNGAYSLKGRYTQEQVDEFTYELLRRVTQSPTLNNKIKSINSGGQTGLDEAGTKAGIRLDIPTTIIAPKGWMFKTEDGSTVTDEKAFKDRFKGVEVEEQTLQPVTGPKGQMGFHKKKKEKEKEKATEEGAKTITLDSQIGERGDLVNFTTGFDNEHEKPEDAYAYEIVSVKTNLDTPVDTEQFTEDKRDLVLEADNILQEIRDLEKIDTNAPDISADPNHPVFKQFHESIRGSIKGARALLNAELQEIRNVPTSKEDRVAALKKIKVEENELKTYLKKRPAEIAKDLRILSNLEKPSFMQEGYVEAENARERKKILVALNAQRKHLLTIVERHDNLKRPFQKPPTFTYTLRAVTPDQAKRDLNWLDLPIASLPSAKRGGEYFNPFTDPHMWENGAKKPFYKPQKGKFTPRGQYFTIRDALGKATRVAIRNVDPEIMKDPEIKPEDKAAAREETKAFPVREALRMIDRKEGRGRNGMLHTASATQTKPTPYSIPFRQGHRIMSLMLSIVEQTDQNTHASITDAQRRISDMQEKRLDEISDITDYSNVRVATDADGNPASRTPLHAMLLRIRRQTAFNQRKDKKGDRAVNYDTPRFGENINDMLIPLIAGATELYGRDYNEMSLFLLNEYREGRVSTSAPNIFALEKRKTSITPNEIDDRIQLHRDKIKLLRKRLAKTPGDKQTIRQLKDIVTAEKEARAEKKELLKELESEKGKRLNPYEWLEDTGYDVFQLSKPEPDTIPVKRKTRATAASLNLGLDKKKEDEREQQGPGVPFTRIESEGTEFVGKAPSQKYIDEIWDHVAALTAMTSGEAPGNVGDVVANMQKGESWVTKSVDKIESWTGIEPVPDSDIDKQVEPGSWQDKWLNGVGKDYDYVKAVYEFLKSNNQDIKKASWWPSYENLAKEATRLEAKARKAETLLANKEAAFKKLGKGVQKKNKGKLSHYRKQAAGSRKLADKASDEATKALNEGDPGLVAFPEIQLLEVPTSKIQDTRFANWAWLSPVVMGNFLEKNTVKHLFSIPKKNKAGNITQGGLAGGWIVQTGFLKTAIDHYGELTENEPQAMDHGLTYADLVKEAKAKFENNLKLIDEKVKEAEANDESPGAIKRLKALKDVFLNLHGDPNLTADIDGKSEEGQQRKSVAWRGFMVAYFAHKIQRLTGHAGGIVASQQGTLGTFEASAGETTTDKSNTTDDKGDDAEGGDVLRNEEGEEVSVQGADVNETTKGDNMDDVWNARPEDIMEDLEVDDTDVKSVKKSDKARFQKLAKMTATEIKNSDDPLISWAMGQNLTPAEFKKILKLAMSPKQFTSPQAEKLIPDADLRQRLQVAMSKRSESIALGSELGLSTDVPSLMHDRDVLAVRAAMMGGYKKLPESWKKGFDKVYYKIRLGISNQHASLEEMALRINKELYGDKMTAGMDFFDMMGVILPTFAKTKTASRIFRAKYRQPLMDSLKKVGYSMKEAGRLFQNLGALTFNHKIRMKLKEARKEAQKILDKSIEQQKRAEEEWAKLPDDKKTKELTKAHKESLESFKKTQKKQKADVKAFSEDQYFNDKGEFRPSGISNEEMAKYLEQERTKTRFTGLEKLAEDKNALGIWTKMNARTIQVQWETGQITFGEAISLIASSSVAQTPQRLENLVADHLGLLDKKGKFNRDSLDAEDLAEWDKSKKVFEDTFKSTEHKELVAFAKQHSIPDGYYYAPMRGFENNEFHYEEREEIEELLGGNKKGQKGWNASSSNKVSEYAMGRKKGADRPDPRSAIAHAFAAHDEAVMRGTKQVPGQRMREWYELFLAMRENKETIEKGGKVKWSEETLEVLKENNLEGAFKNPRKLQFLWEEFNSVFDYTTETDLGITPTKETTRIQNKTQTNKDGTSFTRPVMRRGDYPIARDDTTVFLVKNKGKMQFVKFKENPKALKLVRELGNMDGFVMPKLIQPVYNTVNSVTRLLANAYTSWSPEFIITNAVKDMLGGFFNLTEDSKTKIKGDVAKDLLSYGSIVKAIYDVEKSTTEGTRSESFVGMTKEEAVKKIAPDDWKSWFKFFEAHGMRTAFTAPEQLTESMRQIENDLKSLDTEGLSPTAIGNKLFEKKMAIANSAVFKWVEHANAAVENVMRVVTAKNLLTSTDPSVNFTTQQAVMAGRNITVDFNRKGVISSNIGALIVFFNAGMQGSIRFFKSLTRRPSAAKMAFGIVGVSVLHGVLSRIMTQRDEDDEEGPGNWYDEHPEFRKNTTAILHFGPSERHLKVPLPWGPNLLWMLGQKIANVVSGQYGLSASKNGIIENGLEGLSDIHSTMNPVAKSLWPTAMAPFAQLSKNENFFGGTISREDGDFVKYDTPGAYKHKFGTKKVWVDLAQWMNSVKGGDRVTPGSLKRMLDPNYIGDEEDDMLISTLSGSDIEHLFDSSGGFMRNISQLFSGASSLAEGQINFGEEDDINWDQLPFISKFYGKEPQQSGTYYAYKRLAERANRAVDGMEEKKGNVSPQQYKDFVNANRPYIPLLAMVNNWEKDRKKLTAKIAKIEDSNLPADKKLDMVRPLEKQRVVRMRKILHYAHKHNIDV